MFPFRDEHVFIRNNWYVGCLAEEISTTPFERVIMDKPVVFFRTASGKAAAMHGLCPHRYHPLALHGKVIGDTIQCNYHGFTFDSASGLCVRIPSAPNAPKNYTQRVYPVIERGPWIWIWPGAPELADESLLPTLADLHLDPSFVTSPMLKPVLMKGRFMLALENLMDLTHIGFLHAFTADFDEIVQAPMEVTESDADLRVVRQIRITWGTVHDALYKPENRFEGKGDADSVTIVHGPAYVTNTSNTPRHTDEAGTADPKIFGEVWFHHVLTPATKTSTHYFGTQSRSHRTDDNAFGQLLHVVDTKIRAEDIEAIEAIEQQIQNYGDPPVELLTKSDAAAGRLRRRMQHAIDVELGRATRDSSMIQSASAQA